jgi:hypothetical protein
MIELIMVLTSFINQLRYVSFVDDSNSTKKNSNFFRHSIYLFAISVISFSE